MHAGPQTPSSSSKLNYLSPSSNASSTRYILPGDRLDMQPEPEIGCSRRHSFAQAIRQQQGAVDSPSNQAASGQLLSSGGLSTAGYLRGAGGAGSQSDFSHSDSLSSVISGGQHQPAAGKHPSTAPGHKKEPPGSGNFLSISDECMLDIRSWRRSLALVLFALGYGIFAFAATMLTKPYASSSGSDTAFYVENPTWSQEMIAGWHRERPLVLATHFKMEATRKPADSNSSLAAADYLQPERGMAAGVRECGDQAWLERIDKTPQVSGGGTSVRPQLRKRRRRKFTALNGCLFRRDATSDPLGDLCCCAGQPRWTTAQPQSPHNHTATRSNNATLAADTPQPPPPRHYLRPQILCFLSASASLFNPLQLEAPLVGEHSLKHAHNEYKGARCVACSCCHEHEPDKVNKLLAGVPLHADEAQSKSLMLDKNGNQRRLPAGPSTLKANSMYQSGSGLPAADDEPGFWDGVRARLMNWMRALDQLFFWLLDVLDLSLLAIRQGISPPGVNDSSTLFFYQASLVRPPFEGSLSPVAGIKLALKTSEPPNLFIDDDAYDAFTTTTASPSSTSTTTTTTTSSTTTSTTTRLPSSSSTAPNHTSTTTSSRPRERQRTRRTKRPTTTSTRSPPPAGPTTTKGPTVIINVYASSQNSPTSTSTTQPPAPATGQPTKSAAAPSAPPKSVAASNSSDPADTGQLAVPIELHIQLDNSHANASQLNSSSATTTRPPRLDAPHLTDASGRRRLEEAAASSPGPSSPTLSSINFVTSPQATSAQPKPDQPPRTGAPQRQPGRSSIVISLGAGNSTTVIATINATAPAASAGPPAQAESPSVEQLTLLSLLRHPDEPSSTIVIARPTSSSPGAGQNSSSAPPERDGQNMRSKTVE